MIWNHPQRGQRKLALSTLLGCILFFFAWTTQACVVHAAWLSNRVASIGSPLFHWEWCEITRSVDNASLRCPRCLGAFSFLLRGQRKLALSTLPLEPEAWKLLATRINICFAYPQRGRHTLALSTLPLEPEAWKSLGTKNRIYFAYPKRGQHTLALSTLPFEPEAWRYLRTKMGNYFAYPQRGQHTLVLSTLPSEPEARKLLWTKMIIYSAYQALQIFKTVFWNSAICFQIIFWTWCSEML